MTTKKRKQYSGQFKFQVAVEAAKGLKTVNQIASERELHPNQVSQWKRHLLEEGGHLFKNGNGQASESQEQAQAELYEQIGRLKMELEWLKKKVA